MKFIDYIFYKTNIFTNDYLVKTDSPELTTACIVGIFLYLDIFIAILLIDQAFNIDLFMTAYKEYKFFKYILGLCDLSLMYFLFMYKKKYLIILNKYETKYNKNPQSYTKKLLGSILVILFYIMSIMFWILILDLVRKK
jgi:hypothetical protein